MYSWPFKINNSYEKEPVASNTIEKLPGIWKEMIILLFVVQNVTFIKILIKCICFSNNIKIISVSFYKIRCVTFSMLSNYFDIFFKMCALIL